VPALTEVRMHTDQPTVLEKVYHAVVVGKTSDEETPVASTAHSFVLPDVYPFVGGGEGQDGVIIHITFPTSIKNIADLNMPSPAFECRVPVNPSPSLPSAATSEADPSTVAVRDRDINDKSEDGDGVNDQSFDGGEDHQAEAGGANENDAAPGTKLADVASNSDESDTGVEAEDQHDEEEEDGEDVGESEEDEPVVDKDDGEGMNEGETEKEEGDEGDEGDDEAPTGAGGAAQQSPPRQMPRRPHFAKLGVLLGGACVLFGGGLMLFRQFSTEQKRQVKRQHRSRVIAEAEEQPELLPEIQPADVESAEAAGTVKVHVELPAGDIVSFRVKRRRLGASFDELCAVIVQGVPGKAFTIAQLSGMEMQYEDKDGDSTRCPGHNALPTHSSAMAKPNL
jgi:hypothetical protein